VSFHVAFSRFCFPIFLFRLDLNANRPFDACARASARFHTNDQQKQYSTCATSHSNANLIIGVAYRSYGPPRADRAVYGQRSLLARIDPGRD
jgi:hypothetical protein